MQVELYKVAIRDLAQGYKDSAEDGVVAFGGQLDVRPKYQREFVYKDEQRKAVINTVLNGFPLNVMYWVDHEDGTYEVLDGQQRTLSICQYVSGDFSVDIDGSPQAFHNLSANVKEKILYYELMVYFCKGTDDEKLKWFKTVNIAGEKLTEQELRNAVYCGPWLSDAKRYFSKSGCAAYNLAKDYVTGSPIRQDYLERAIDWKSGSRIKEYMSDHQQEQDAKDLWNYFQAVIAWTQTTFPHYRKEMKGLPWGLLYNKYQNKKIDAAALETECARLMKDDDVTKKSGIYLYLLTGEEKHLNIRAFDSNMKRSAYERQEGACAKCGMIFDIDDMEADHITPWNQGGRTVPENCQMLCRDCNRRKSDS